MNALPRKVRKGAEIALLHAQHLALAEFGEVGPIAVRRCVVAREDTDQTFMFRYTRYPDQAFQRNKFPILTCYSLRLRPSLRPNSLDNLCLCAGTPVEQTFNLGMFSRQTACRGVVVSGDLAMPRHHCYSSLVVRLFCLFGFCFLFVSLPKQSVEKNRQRNN